MLLAGDIGGTKTSLAVFSLEDGPRTPLARTVFRSAEFPSLEALVQKFVSGVSLPITTACFGVAGPVVAGRAQITNLPWLMDEVWLASALSMKHVHLLNDLQSIAYGVPHLEPEDLHTLYKGRPVAEGAIGVIAPGTGLGEAFLLWDGSRYTIHPSEGGHADFAPTDERQIGLLRYLLGEYGHVSYERVCSGMGIPNIYAYLKQDKYAPEPEWLARELAQARDRTPVIVDAALEARPGSELCQGAISLFVSILVAEAGNLALKVLATGGVYIGGGIPPRILPLLEEEDLLETFRRKGRFVDLLADVPIHLILNPDAALFGTACFGLERFAAQ